MCRQHQEVVAKFWAALILAAGVAAGLAPSLVKAASDSSTVTEVIAICGSVSNSTINNIVNQQDPAVLAEMAKVFAGQLAASAEAKVQAEAQVKDLATGEQEAVKLAAIAARLS